MISPSLRPASGAAAAVALAEQTQAVGGQEHVGSDCPRLDWFSCHAAALLVSSQVRG
jgi:hypothetical protein